MKTKQSEFFNIAAEVLAATFTLFLFTFQNGMPFVQIINSKTTKS